MKTLNQINKTAGIAAALFLAVQMGSASPVISDAASVEAEAAITDISNVIQAEELWFPVSINDPNETDHNNQQVSEQPSDQTPSGDCAPTNTGKICSVKLDISGVTDQAAYDELIDRIDDPMEANPTIQEFLDLGASFEEYSRELAP